MLGDVMEASRRDLRHSWRRDRLGVSAPRKRDRAIALRLPYAGHGKFLDAQWLSAGRRREDVEEPRQFCHHQRLAAGLAGRSGAVHNVANPLSTTAQLDFGGFA